MNEKPRPAIGQETTVAQRRSLAGPGRETSMTSLMQRASKLEAEGVFLGGPARLFETAGRKILMILLSEGLCPQSRVLDVGCGCLRAGYWLIHFLDQGRYFGIEPHTEMLEAGIRTLLEPGLADLKKPRFDDNARFDFTVFGERFDFFVARSIWTHASKGHIQIMLDGFVSTKEDEGVFLASYRSPKTPKEDYLGAGWVGRSHESDSPGMVCHSLGWIQRECTNRGLEAEEIHEETFNFGNQTWIRIKHKTG